MGNGRVRSPAIVIVLSLLTCGIYALIWYYEVSCELQEALGRHEDSPGLEVLLIILTCGLYTVYWWYKYGRMVADLEAARGLPVRDNSMLLMVLSLLGFWYGPLDLVNMAIMQSDLNSIWESSVWAP